MARLLRRTLLPIGGVLLAMIPVLVLGWIMRTNVGLLLGGFLWPLVLVAGFIMAILLMGVLFGFPLMWGAISAEGTDSFDALSRSYAYVFQRPLHYLFYIVVAGLLGWLGWIVVWNFAEGIIWLGYWAAGWGCGSDQIDSIAPTGIGCIGFDGRFGADADPFLDRLRAAVGRRLHVQLFLDRLDGHLFPAPPGRGRHGNGRSLPRRRRHGAGTCPADSRVRPVRSAARKCRAD